MTHDHIEAFELANEIVVLDNGNIAQIGTPQEIIDHPANYFIKNFLDVNKNS